MVYINNFSSHVLAPLMNILSISSIWRDKDTQKKKKIMMGHT